MENNQKVIQPAEIVVSDGYEVVSIKNLFGKEIGRLYLQPSDYGIINRFNDLIENFDKIIEPFNKVVRTDGMSDSDFFDAQWDAMEEAKELLFAAFDEAFAGNFSEAFFGTVHPFSPVNGEFYCMNALRAAGQYISAKFHTETKKLSVKTEQYVHGYRSGKHRNGNRNRGGGKR